MFQNLKPNKNYSISVTMRNGVGEGPPAVTYVTTTPEPAGTFFNAVQIKIFQQGSRNDCPDEMRMLT